MIYKQNGRSGPGGGGGRLEEERKLLELWVAQEVEEDYQAIVLRFLDGLGSRAELARQLQAELRSTYQRDSHYFRIDKLMHERDKTLAKLHRETELLERFKHERGEPELEPVCQLIDHLRKVHLLLGEAVQEMFAAYGHPRQTRVGYSYLELFRDIDEDVQFLRESLLKFYMPFAAGFDPLFLELSQRLRKCYANESLVYDPHVEELINLNASYLYRLLRAQQRMVEAISAADNREQEPAQYQSRGNVYPHSYARNMLDSITEEEPKARSTQPTERFESSRLIRDDSRRFSTPKQLERQFARAESPIQRKTTTTDAGVQKEAPRLEIIKENIRIPREGEKMVFERAPLVSSVGHSPKYSPVRNEETLHKAVRTPRKLNKANDSEEGEEPKPLRFYRKLEPSTPTVALKNHHKRTLTEGNSSIKRPRESRLRQPLPKLTESRQERSKDSECLCRQRYRDKHCEHQEEELSEQELQRRRKQIVREVQAKYRALAQREMRHQLSKLGDATFHKLRRQEHSRVARTRTVQPA